MRCCGVFSGRHAAPAAESEGEVLYRGRARPGVGGRGDAGGGLRVQCGGFEAGSELRVFPDGGDADERAGHGERAAVGD